MESESGRTKIDLSEMLPAEPYRFDFFQAVRLLERLDPSREPVGRYAPPEREVVRFRARASVDFPPSEIYSLKPSKNGEPPEMTVAMMGLTGPSGVLPQAYTEQVLECLRQWRVDRTERERKGDERHHPLVDFLDIFNHRLISLFYRAWEKYHFPVEYERDGNDAFTQCLFALIGLGTTGLRGRLSFPDDGLLAYGGLLMQRPRSSGAMAAILRDYFNVPVEVNQFVPRQLKLDDSLLTRLNEANHQLGVDTVAGSLVWECQSKFRLIFGPLGWSEFLAFLPDGEFRQALAVETLLILRTLTGELRESEERAKAEKALTRLLLLIFRVMDLEKISARCFIGTAYRPAIELTQMIVGREFDFDLQPVLKAADVPVTRLTTNSARQSSLGLTSWLTWPNFRITAQTLQKLTALGLPVWVVAELEKLKDVTIKGEYQLYKMLCDLIGEQQVAQLQPEIMKHARIAPVPKDADQVVLEGVGY